MTELSGAWHTEADLTGYVWTGLTVEEATFEQCDLAGIRATAGTWRHTLLDRCVLDGADLAALTTSDCSLLGTSIDRARLTASSWLRSRWRDLSARDVRAEGFSAVNASWQDVALSGATLTEADFSGSTFRRVRFVDCDLRQARFSSLSATEVSFTRCSLEGVTGVESLRGASLDVASAASALPAMAAHLGIRLADGDTAGKARA